MKLLKANQLRYIKFSQPSLIGKGCFEPSQFKTSPARDKPLFHPYLRTEIHLIGLGPTALIPFRLHTS